MKIKDIIAAIEEMAPLALQENYDNSGLQVGNIMHEAKAVLLCLDVTEAVIDEAVALGCNLIISHHPLAFKPFKSLTGKNYIERCMIKACKYDLTIYAAHTNIDNSQFGINNYVARLLNLKNVRVLSPMEGQLMKLVVFVPVNHLENVRTALFDAGAGTIGEYDCCSYSAAGNGTFKAGKGTDPFCGHIGQFHTEAELRLEVILPAFKKPDIQRAVLSSHPYEEPAFDFYKIENKWNQAGSGIVGTLEEPMEQDEFLYYMKDTLRLNTVMHSCYTEKMVHEIAICSGSGAFLIPEAIRYGADVFITGEAKYNDFYNVEDKILLAVLGHYESEIFTKDLFFEILSKKYPNFAVNKSGYDENPVKYL